MKDKDKTKEQLINELVEMRQRVAELGASETERKRAEEALRESERRLRRRNKILAELARSKAAERGDLNAALKEITEASARTLNVARVNVWLYNEERSKIRCIEQYKLSEDRHSEGYELTAANYPSYFKALEEERTIAAHDAHTDPRTKEFSDSYLSPFGITSMLDAPIRLGGRMVGVICHEHVGPARRWSLEEQNFAGSMADFVSLAIEAEERKRAEEEIRRRKAQLEALRQVGLDLTAQLDLDVLLHSIVSRAIELVGGTCGGLYLYRPGEDVLEWAMAVGPHLAPIGTVLHRDEGLSGKIWETGEPLIVDDYQHWERRAAVYEGYPFKAVVGVPVRWGEEFLGVLNVLADSPRIFVPTDAELLSLFATQAATAIRNARLYEETRRRALEQETVSRIAYALNTPDVRDAFPVLVEGLQELTGCDMVSLIALDEAVEQFITTVLESPFPIPGEGDAMPLSATAAAEDIEAGRPHLTADLSTETHFSLEQALYQAGLRSRVTLPLLVGGEVFGALSMGGSHTGLFREDQLPLLQQIADAVALALENSLFFQTERERRELAEALEETTAALTATLDFDLVLDRILEQVSRVVPNDAANIMLIEGDQTRIVRWRGYERFGVEEFVSTIVFRIPEVANLQQMLDSGEPMVIPDTAAYPGWVQVPMMEWLRSYTGAPIIARGEVIGFLNMYSATPGFFIQDHAEALRAFAGHAAAAIENARLYEAERRRIAELETLRQASLHLTSALDLRPILEAILDHAFKLVAANDVHVFLYDGERLAFGAALWEDGRQQEPYAEPRPQGLTYTVARSGERIVVPDVNSHPLFRDYRWGGSIVGLPLRVGERVVGVMNVAFDRPHAFDESELRVLGLLADQAAIAIENARLYEETRQRALEQETLREAALALTTALDRNEVIDRILAQLQQVVPYDSASVQLLREDRMELVGGRGFPNLPDLLGISFPADGDNPNSEVIRTRSPFIVEDAPTVYEGFRKGPHLQTVISSWLGVPMLIGEQLVGMIALDKSEPGFYTQEHARLAEAFAAQAAVAIENARLYEEEKRRAAQLALINEVGDKAASILDSDRLMQEVTRSIQESFNYYNVAFTLLDEERREMVTQAVAGGFEHLIPGEYRQSVDEGIAGFVTRTGNPWLANDVSKDPYYIMGPFQEVLTKSELCVPVKLGDEVIGALDVQSIHLDAFDEEDVAALEAVANRVAIGIQNARLYEEMAGLYDVGLAVTSALELDKTLGAIYEQVNRLMSLDTFYIALYDKARGELRFEIFVEEGEWLPKFTKKLDEGGLTTWIVQFRKPLLIGDIEKESLPVEPSQRGKPGIRSWMGFPLIARGKVVGVISVQSFRPQAFTEGNKRTLSAFANQAAIAIENARFFEETERLKAFNESIVQGMSEGIAMEDAEGYLTFVNPAAAAMLGYSPAELLGQHCTTIVPPDQQPLVQAADERRARGEADRYELELLRKDGTRVPVLISGSPRFEGGRFAGTLTVYTDITQRKRMEETLRALALVDDLTNLYNRRGFFTLAEQQLKTADRVKRKMALLFADFDGLKQINDAMGHSEGDRALIETAHVFRETFRESDIIARIGGDEFVVLATETSKTSANAIATRLQEKLEARNAREGRRYDLSLSMGLARYNPEHPCSIDELLAQADRAMYERKQRNHQLGARSETFAQQ